MVRVSLFILLVLVGVSSLGGVSTFILPPPPGFTTCPGIAPCHCSGWTLSCSGQHLTTFPPFKAVTVYVTQAYIDMSSNMLQTVPENAFQDITFGSSASLRITFTNNKLTDIEENAFLGLEDKVFEIKLDNNQLTYIPEELGRIRSLKSLSLNDNPITTLSTSANVLHSLGSHLIMLNLDFANFVTWSSELGYLSSLNLLKAKHFNFSPVADNAFSNFGSHLTNVFITSSTMNHLPDSLCQLSGLFRLEVTHNQIIHMTSKIFSSSCSANRLNSVTLENNGITSIPNDLTTSSSHIQTIHLDHNALTDFPRVLNVLKELTSITIGYNSITSLQRADLSGLTALSGLYIHHNPIRYISADTFVNNVGLESLSLEHTQVQIIPSSLVPLPKFRILYLRESPIQCSCAAMGAFKSFKSWRYQLFGACVSSGTDVNTYIRGSLQNCH